MEGHIDCSAKLSPPRRENALLIASSNGEELVEIISDVDGCSIHQESTRSEEEVEERDEKEVFGPHSKRPQLSDAQSDKEAPAKTAAIEIVSNLDGDQPEEQASSVGPRKPYSLQKKDLPPELARLLEDAKYFFTRPHSLERHGQHVANSMYTKPRNAFFVSTDFTFYYYYSLHETFPLLAGSLTFLMASGFKLTISHISKYFCKHLNVGQNNEVKFPCGQLETVV